MSPIIFPTTPIRKDLLMAQATKTRFDKDGVVYVRLRDAWYRLDGDAGEPVPEGFNPNELLTAEQLQAHIKAQAADKSAESPKQRPSFALGQVWRLADGQEATVVVHYTKDNTFLLMNDESAEWFYPDGMGLDERKRGVVAVEYLRETDRPRLEVGKRYRTASGKIVTIVANDGFLLPFMGDNGNWYQQFGFRVNGIPLVALVEEEPTKAEQPAENPKKNPPLAVGQVWRMRNGKETLIFREYEYGGFRHGSLDGQITDVAGERGCLESHLVEYLRETDRVRIELGREYLRSDGKKAKVVKDINNGGFFSDDLGLAYSQFSWCNNITLDKELPTPGDEVSYFSQDEDKWLSGWIVRGTNEDGTTTFLIPKELEEGGHTKFGVATEHVRIDVRSTIPPRNIGDLWRRRDGELYAINYYHEQITSLSEGHYPHGDLVQYVGKAMAAAGDVLAQFTHQDDAISFVKQNSTNERRLTIVKHAQSHELPSLGPWIVHKILYLPTLAIEIE